MKNQIKNWNWAIKTKEAAMKLCRVVGTKHIHKEIDLPPFKNDFVLVTGRRGLACDTNYGFFFQVKSWKGKDGDLTCPKCIALAQSKK